MRIQSCRVVLDAGNNCSNGLQVRHTVESELHSLNIDDTHTRPGGGSSTNAAASARGRERAHASKAGSKLDARIAALQRNPTTFCEDPQNIAAFEQFCTDFNLETNQAGIDELLGSNAFMRELHARLVPHVVDECTFWQRYFFRCAKFAGLN